MSSSKKNNKALYAQIADDIRYKIESKLVSEGEKLPGEFDLAKQYGVSRITSKKALDVLESEGLIYRVKGSGSFVARQDDSKINNKMLDMIAIVLPFEDIQGKGMDEILHGTQAVAGENGYYVSVHNSQGSLKTERDIICKLIRDGIKGIIYYPIRTSENFDLLYMLSEKNYPIVMIDKHDEDIPIDSVVSDNFEGGYMITEYLIKKGHRNIAFVSGEPIDQLSSIKDRFLGYFKALKDYKIPLNIDHVIYDFESVPQENVLEYIMNISGEITCIQAVSDVVAIEILKDAQDKGLSIPQDLSIVGFDDLNIAALANPGMTTIKQDFYRIGAQGAELAIARIRNPNKAKEKIKLPVELVIRESVTEL